MVNSVRQGGASFGKEPFFVSVKDLFPSLTLTPSQRVTIDRAIALKKQARLLELKGLKLKAQRLSQESEALINGQVDQIVEMMKSSAGNDFH